MAPNEKLQQNQPESHVIDSQNLSPMIPWIPPGDRRNRLGATILRTDPDAGRFYALLTELASVPEVNTPTPALPRRGRGRPRGPAENITKAGLERKLRDANDRLKMKGSRPSEGALAKQCGYSRGTLRKYAKEVGVDLQAFIRWAKGKRGR